MLKVLVIVNVIVRGGGAPAGCVRVGGVGGCVRVGGVGGAG